MPTTLWGDSENSSSAAWSPLALLTNDGKTITEPLLKIT